MIQNAHEGHLAILKTKARARKLMWWPGMCEAMETAISRCDVCAQFLPQQHKEPLMSTTTPTLPWHLVGSDSFEWEGRHYLVVDNYYSRFPEVRALENTRGEDVISACREIFSCHGIPEVFVSDNCPQYVNNEFIKLAQTYGFQHVTSSPRYPQGNVLVERIVQTLTGLLRKAVFSSSDFQLALLAYRTTQHESTGASPAQLLMGRRLRGPLPIRSSQLEPKVVSQAMVSETRAVRRLNHRTTIDAMGQSL